MCMWCALRGGLRQPGEKMLVKNKIELNRMGIWTVIKSHQTTLNLLSPILAGTMATCCALSIPPDQLPSSVASTSMQRGVLVTLHQLAFSDGCDRLANQAVQPKHALADRIAAAHEYVVFSVPTLPVFSMVVYNHTIPRQSPDWSLERVARNNRITEVAESNQVLNGALNFELGLLDGYRFHHRHQGATDGHPADCGLDFD